MPNIFDRFRQADGSHTRREGGLGLGLSIARHLVELHGGELRAHSDGIGCGATFTMTIPAVRAPCIVGDDTVATDTNGIRLDGIRVLVVDDERDARELLDAVLSRAGATLEHADSVAAALTAIRTRAPDIVVSDIGMPERSGYDLVGELRSRSFERPVVALTAFATSEDRTRALRSGFRDHVAKPVEPATLVKTVAGLVGECSLEKEANGPPAAGCNTCLHDGKPSALQSST